jgi:hypothetical protein
MFYNPKNDLFDDVYHNKQASNWAPMTPLEK